jgi:hypothetical protein
VLRNKLPLLQMHRRRLIAGACVIAPAALVALFSDALGGRIGVSSGSLELGALVILAWVTVWLARGTRCPRCKSNLFWYGVNHRFGNWLGWLLTESTCPKCGYTTSEGSGGQAG